MNDLMLFVASLLVPFLAYRLGYKEGILDGLFADVEDEPKGN